MGLLDWGEELVESTVSGVRQLFQGAEHVAGEAAQGAAHLAGDGLDAVGLHSAASTVDNWGDQAADYLGDQVAEMELGQTSDPTQLIHGDVSGLNTTVTNLQKFATAFGETSTGMSGIDTSTWQGQSADAFRTKFAPQPQQWSTAQTACGNAASALSTYAQTVQWAQGQAKQAIDLYNQGQQATQQAEQQYNQAVDSYNQAADSYNAAIAAGNDPGTAPTQPGPFADPGAALRQQAQQLLTAARQQRDSAGEQAASTVTAATNTAPQEPTFAQQLVADITDTQDAMNIGAVHFVGGIAKGTLGLVNVVRALNPMDPYNMTHPAEYVDGLSTTAAGLVHTALHPTQLVSSLVGSGWGSDPFEAMGKLVPNVALAVATDGAGEAALGERAALGATEDVATGTAARTAAASTEEDLAGSALREDAGQPLETARTPESTPTVDDPVDVATGQVLLPQVDVDLPGALPLVLTRTHLSGYRLGGWFGRSWTSTVDMRLEVDPTGVILVGADGVRLFYPHPGIGAPVLPEEGARWPLTRVIDGGYAATDPATGRTYRFPRPYGSGRWPLGEIGDRNGHRIVFYRDDTGAPTEIGHDGGYRVLVTVADGRITALRLAGEPDVDLMRYGYTDGNLTEVTNASGQPLRLAYDTAGRLVEWTDRNGVRYGYRYDDYGRCVHTEGPDGVLSGTFDHHPDERYTTHTDTSGAVTRYEYDERLRIVAETDPLGNTTRSEYHRYGWLLSRTDPLGRTFRYEHDEAGNPITVTRPDGTQTLVEYTAGQPSTVVDPDGAIWRYTYDERGNRTTAVDPAGAVTRYDYTDRGHLATVTDALGGVTVVDTDAAGLPVAVTDPTGAIVRFTRDGFGRVVEQTDPAGGTTEFGWTVDGRPAWRRAPDGATERWRYDGEGNLTEHVDELGRATQREYAHLDALSASTTADGARLEYAYDHRLRLVSVTNQQGLVWRNTYDPAGRLLAETDFNGATIRYGYDAAGQLVSRTNAVGQTVTYERDALGKVVTQRAGDDVSRFTYDPAGRLVHAGNADGELRIERDVLGRVLAETTDGRTLAIRYDALGRQIERVTPAGVRSAWTYDRAGRPSAVRAAGHTVAFRHDPAGREVERRLDSVFGLVQTWDAGHRLTTQTLLGAAFGDEFPSSVPTAMLQRRAYRYSDNGQLLAVVDHLAGTRRLDTDPAGRITAVRAGHGQETYRYDPAGNITHAGWPVDQPDSAPVGGRDYTGTLITRAGNIRYHHDSAGRLVSRTRRTLSGKELTWRYAWDATERLAAVITPDGTRWRYRYDPLGRRVAKQRMAGETVTERVDFTWAGTQLVEQRHDDVRVTTWDYAPGEHRPLCQVESSGTGQDWFDQRFYAIVTDLIGTPTELVDARGALAWHEQTTVWGAALGRSGGQVTMPLRFPGQYHDAETGLHYNYHRYYDPATARYTTADPLGLALAPNPYTYVDNPTVATDPLGLGPCTPTGQPQTLYHYTTEAGQQGIIDSGELRPSLKATNPKDARYGDGQYLSDIQPGTMTNGQLAYQFTRMGFLGDRFSNYLEIDVSGLNVVQGRPGVFVVPNSGPLDVSNRIVSFGKN